jgi:REP element-mobilizing transposase RayT
LKSYDYTQAGYYFVTICTEGKKHTLGEVASGMEFHEQQLSSQYVGGGFHAAPQTRLSLIGEEVQKSILKIPEIYDSVEIDQYVIMPNHIHLIVILEGGHGNPPLHDIIGRMKSFTTKRYNQLNNTDYVALWQRNYYEHVIRNDKELQEIRQYIVNNPAKWELDKYYTE